MLFVQINEKTNKVTWKFFRRPAFHFNQFSFFIFFYWKVFNLKKILLHKRIIKWTKFKSRIHGLWFCHVCEKEMNFSSRLRHIISNTHNLKGRFGIVVQEYQFSKPEIDGSDYILDDVTKNCQKNFFIHSKLNVCMILRL